MEGPKTIRNISQKDSATLNIKFETDCAVESGEVSAQYVSERRGNILTALSDRRAPAQNLLDNNGVIFNQSKENYTGDNETSNSFSENLFNNGLGNKTNKIKQIIESAISPESKQTVSKILDQVNQLSIAEKLFLYLKLPTGRSQTTDPLRQPLNPLGSRFEIHQTITWIKTHLEEDQDISLPKQDVYDEYIAYCESIEMKPLSTADFGKVMKQVFPRVRPRRLGTRGNSRYCYAGMRKRVSLDVPLLPDLGETCEDHQDESVSAASCLIREWAEKLLSVKFDNLRDLACHLVGNLCVDSRSVAAFTLMSTLEPQKFFGEKDVMPLLLPSGGQANKHRETQLQLQRKLQEREVIREQKRRMQEQQSSGHRTQATVKRTKLSHATTEQDSNCDTNNTLTSDVLAGKVEVPEMFSQVPQIPAKTNDNVTNGGDTSKLASHAQCQNQPEVITNLMDVPNKNLKLLNRSPSTNVKSRHLSLDFEPNLSHTKISGRNSAMDHSEVLKSDKSKSSLRFYLESLPTKKGRKVPPIQDLSKEFPPNVVEKPPAKLPIPRLCNPNKKLPPNLIILPPVPIVHKSPRNKYKPIQPKVESPTDQSDASKKKARTNGVTESVGHLASIVEPRRRNEVSIGCLEKDALDDYLHGGGNSQEQEEELMQYFQHDPPDKLSQLRLLLERNLSPVAPPRLNKSNLVLPSLLHGANYSNTRRRVSFETSVTENSVPQSPNTRRRTFNFTPIAAGPHSPLGRASKPSSANASPFVSPRNTPVPRSKQIQGQVPSQSSFVASPRLYHYPQRNQNTVGSLEQLLAKSDTFSPRQNVKLQRSQSVNSNSATLQYLLQSGKNQQQGNIVDSKMFAMPGELHATQDSFPRASNVSISAPQSPLVYYQARGNPFDLKTTGGSYPGDQFLAMENNILNLKSIDGCDLVDESSVQVDTLSQEVSRFFPEYRSQSVPLRRVNDPGPTPVPSEYRDFGPDLMMDAEVTVQEGLNSENLSQIFNLLDAEGGEGYQGQACTPLPYTSTVEYVTDVQANLYTSLSLPHNVSQLELEVDKL